MALLTIREVCHRKDVSCHVVLLPHVYFLFDFAALPLRIRRCIDARGRPQPD